MNIVRTLPIVALALAATAAQADGPFQFYSITPCRAVDTRLGQGGAIAGGAIRPFKIQGVCGVPVGAKAASINILSTQSTSIGFLTLFPGGTPLPSPLVSTLNFAAGDNIANGAIVALSSSTSGDLSVYAGMGSAYTTHVVIDVTGYFAP